MRSSFFLFLGVLISVEVYSQTEVSEHINPEGHYSFTPLKDWRVRTNGSDSDVYAPADGEMDSWDEKLEFNVTDGEGIELNDAFDFYINTDFPNAYRNFKVIDQGTEQINGLQAKWATFTFYAQGTAAGGTGSGDSSISATLQALFYLIKKNNSLYLVSGVTEKNLFAQFNPSFRAIIRTFRTKE
jgi:hypothetical protein